jgi:hypothetical protein
MVRKNEIELLSELITWREDNIRIDILEIFSKGGQILRRSLSKRK